MQEIRCGGSEYIRSAAAEALPFRHVLVELTVGCWVFRLCHTSGRGNFATGHLGGEVSEQDTPLRIKGRERDTGSLVSFVDVVVPWVMRMKIPLVESRRENQNRG